MTPAYCKCPSVDPYLDGYGYTSCRNCGHVLPPTHRADPRDRVLLGLVRLVQNIDRKLDALPTGNPPPVDGLIDANEAARRLGRKPDWVRRNADRLSVVLLKEGPRPRKMFSAGLIDSLADGNGAKRAAAPAPARKLAPRRRRAGRADLLPIKGRS